MPNVFLLSVIMPSVIMPFVVLLNVVEPAKTRQVETFLKL
jgi:hypothetical protein